MKNLARFLLSIAVLFSLTAASHAERVVFDNDLTRGKSAFKGKATGGKWDKGWWLTQIGDRIVWDAGYPVKNGYFEFYLTASPAPFAPVHMKNGKPDEPDFHWAGISGIPEIKMEKYVYGLRLGQTQVGNRRGHGWSKIVVLGRNNVEETEKTETVVGDYALWKTVSDGKQPIYFKMEWKDGVASLYEMNGQKTSCPTKGKKGNQVLISDLRYAWLGGADDERRFTFKGVRFLRARMVDLDKPGSVKPFGPPAGFAAPQKTSSNFLMNFFRSLFA
jgi:hypothetical protein